MPGMDDIIKQAGITGEGTDTTPGNTQAPEDADADKAEATQDLQQTVINQYEARRGRGGPRRPRKPRR